MLSLAACQITADETLMFLKILIVVHSVIYYAVHDLTCPVRVLNVGAVGSQFATKGFVEAETP